VSAPATPSARPRRRSRAVPLLLACVTLGAWALVVVNANIIAERGRARFDATAAGDTALSPRAAGHAAALDGAGPWRIIVAADLRTADPRARRNLEDVLDEVRARSRNLTVTMIDAASARGVEDLRSLVRALHDERAEELRSLAGLAADARARLDSAATAMESRFAPEFAALKADLAGAPAALASFADSSVMLLRLRATDAKNASSRANDAAAGRGGGAARPDLAVGLARRQAEAIADDLSGLVRDCRRLAESAQTPGAAASRARTLAAAMEQELDGLRRTAETLRGAKSPDVLRVEDALRAGAAAIVIGPADTGMAAIDLDELLPSAEWLDAAEASRRDERRRLEDLIAASMGTVLEPRRPIVIFAHAEVRPFVRESRALDALIARLGLRGVDFVEWAVTAGEEPDLREIDPAGDRPRVYAAMCPDSSAAAAPGGLSGAQRAAALGRVVSDVVSRGDGLLLSLAPSMLPALGEADPVAKPLESLGVGAMTGTPLLTRVSTPRGPFPETDRVLQPSESEHPLCGAVRSLPTYFTWCIPLTLPADAVPLYTAPADTATWAESQWLRLRQTPRDQRAALPDAPRFDADRDKQAPENPGAGWVVAGAVEGGGRRVVVVGSNDWFFDQVTQQRASVDARSALAFPGNTELFEASVLWLARQDALIAQGPAARAVAMVRPIDAARLRWLRVGLIAGLPALVLGAGALYRLARR